MSEYIEHSDGATEDDRTLLRLADELQNEWKMGGLSDGLYFEWAAEIATRFARLKVVEEREACASLTENFEICIDCYQTLDNVAKAIRNRGK